MAACVVVDAWKVDTRARNFRAEMAMEGLDAGVASSGTVEAASGMGIEGAEVEGEGAAGVVFEVSLLYFVGKEGAWACSI